VRPDIPAILDAIALRMLERDPDKRYQTGRALADDLEEAMRETQWQSRHLPHLLVDLFGSGTHSSQLAMSRVPPELLASIDDPSAAGSQTPVLNLEPRRYTWRSWRLWAVLLGAATAAGLALGFGLDAKQTRPPTSTVVPAVNELPAATKPPPARPAAGAPVAAQPAIAPPPAEPGAAKPARAKKPAKPRARIDDGAIRGGRSIDPFAEAARRGQP